MHNVCLLVSPRLTARVACSHAAAVFMYITPQQHFCETRLGILTKLCHSRCCAAAITRTDIVAAHDRLAWDGDGALDRLRGTPRGQRDGVASFEGECGKNRSSFPRRGSW